MKQPKIRLKGFQGEWKESAFSESFDSLKNNSLSRAELSDNGFVYNIHYGDVLITYNECVEIGTKVKTFVKDAEIAKKLHQSCAIKNGDIIFADAAEDNTVGKCTEVIAQEEDAIVSGLHTIPCRPKKEFTSRYLGYYLNSKAYHDQLLPHIQGTKISSISKKALAQTHISYPSDKNEQQSIASYFQHLDSLIQSTEKKIEALKQVKAASLQAMFPQEGESSPRVRIGKRTESWMVCNLNDVLQERHESSTITPDLPQLSFTIAEGIIRPEDRKSNQRDFLIKDKDNKRYLVTRVGDIIYNPANVVYGAIHRNSLIDGVVSPIYKIFTTNQDSRFIECVVRRPLFISQLAMRTEGTVTKLKTLKPEAFLDMTVRIPTDLEEQRMIGEYFRNLDSQIFLQTQRLEKLKQIKSACLDNMFV